jgi:hypothetical protein
MMPCHTSLALVFDAEAVGVRDLNAIAVRGVFLLNRREQRAGDELRGHCPPVVRPERQLINLGRLVLRQLFLKETLPLRAANPGLAAGVLEHASELRRSFDRRSSVGLRIVVGHARP